MSNESSENQHCDRWWRMLLVGIRLLGALLLLTAVGFELASVLFPFPRRKLREARSVRASAVVRDRNGCMLRPFLGEKDCWRIRVDLEEISPWLIEATIAVEDKRFGSHPGVDPVAIGRALLSNLKAGRIVSGASTITMQNVRLVTPRPRNLRAKAIEAFRALQMEGVQSKREIMECYLNLAPYGGNLVGVESASRAYFGKSADDLTLGEAALLAGLPQSPCRLRPDRYPEKARKRRNHVLVRMLEQEFISFDQFRRALRSPVKAARQSFPFETPHLARSLKQRHPRRRELHTTIDLATQHACERIVREKVSRLRAHGVTNAAVVVLENDTGSVRALVGSCDFFARKDQGQVDGTRALRSPGSTLKPFTYALAFDSGVATPATVVGDVPVHYRNYAPENYDGQFRGPVSVREALRDSLNVPAVILLERVGQRRLYGLLRELGLRSLTNPPQHYGLALTLGSADVRLLELTGAYATLARMGKHLPVRFLKDQETLEPEPVLGEGACYLVAQILSDPEHLKEVLPEEADQELRMAWKTGTSHGHRDAWTVAFTPDFTVGVWVGNFTGRSSRALVGIEAAAPIAAAIMRRLHADRPRRWYGTPAEIVKRKICAVSGQSAGPHCEKTAEGYFIRGKSSPRECTVHIPVQTEGSEKPRIVEAWPPGLAAWFRRNEPDRPLVGAGGLRGAAGRKRPRIILPASGESYVKLSESSVSGDQRLALLADAAVDRVFWFVDDRFVVSGPPLEKVFWEMEFGRHRIACSDEKGRTACVTITVR
ncbi:MAG: penicillin-binding protein 1C [Planctomycetes bacterium]|nr:penicillin-binding protein 1C [Planctomycetota bacterium]